MTVFSSTPELRGNRLLDKTLKNNLPVHVHCRCHGCFYRESRLQIPHLKKVKAMLILEWSTTTVHMMLLDDFCSKTTKDLTDA